MVNLPIHFQTPRGPVRSGLVEGPSVYKWGGVTDCPPSRVQQERRWGVGWGSSPLNQRAMGRFPLKLFSGTHANYAVPPPPWIEILWGSGGGRGRGGGTFPAVWPQPNKLVSEFPPPSFVAGPFFAVDSLSGHSRPVFSESKTRNYPSFEIFQPAQIENPCKPRSYCC